MNLTQYFIPNPFFKTKFLLTNILWINSSKCYKTNTVMLIHTYSLADVSDDRGSKVDTV